MPLQIDSFNKLILVTSPTTSVDAQTMHDFVQDYLASPRGMVEDGTWDQKGEILKPEGKIEDPSNPGVFSQIILILNPQWQIQFWGGSGYTRIFGGKIVGGVADEPLLATGTAGDITVLESPVDGVTVATGLSVAQGVKITELHTYMNLDPDNAMHFSEDGSEIRDKNGDIQIDRTPSIIIPSGYRYKRQ
jgi:hypothetical protein